MSQVHVTKRPSRSALLPSLTGAALLVLAAAGLITMAQIIYQRAEQHYTQRMVQMAADTLDNIAWKLGSVDPEHPEELANITQQLNSYNRAQTWSSLRLIRKEDCNIIISVTNESEVNTAHYDKELLQQNWPTDRTITWENADNELLELAVVRCPLLQGLDRTPMMLEGKLITARLHPPMAALLGPGAMVLVGTLLLMGGMLYLQRRYFRPLVSISSGLIRHREHLEQEISTLRLASASGTVAQVWNDLIGLVEQLRDAAGQSNAMQELSSALERSATVDFVEAATILPEGVMHLIPGGRVKYVNAMGQRLLGLQSHGESAEKQSMGGKRLEELEVSPLGRKLVEAIKPAVRGEFFENKTATIEGEGEGTFRVRVIPVVSRQRGVSAVVLITDISQYAKAERARDEFVAHVAHELRTPLTNIQAYAETLGEFNDPQIQAECFNVINKETRRLSRLVEEMLSRAQLDLGTIQIRRDHVDLWAMLEEALRDLKATAESKKIELVNKLPAKLPTLHADRDKLAVVINNLLANAIKYTPAGGRVTLSAQGQEDSVLMHFADNGIGVAPEDQEKIFDKLYRVQRDEVLKEVGTGLGLTTAREIVREHGGDITLVSEVGKGSTFTVYMPVGQKSKARLGF
ncbi:MAG: Adaptive-response sensory-kinase SasA [Phycisphaerae bacterium]|nr:Adaptive-response sensory-kinase SasA [Phycisphaerae bacterium]